MEPLLHADKPLLLSDASELPHPQPPEGGTPDLLRSISSPLRAVTDEGTPKANQRIGWAAAAEWLFF
jgi:hypothetical protein